MNYNSFLNFGIFTFVSKCVIALYAIAKIIIETNMVVELISPVREWLCDLIFYSVCASVLVLTVSVIDLMDYTKKNSRRFR